MSKFLKTTSINELELLPNKALQAISKEFADTNRAREKAAKAKEAEERRLQNKERNDERREMKRESYSSFNSNGGAEDLQDVMEALEEGDF